MKNFRELRVWEKSHDLTIRIYSITRRFPKEELFGLTSQMRRASASIPTNIAESCGRNSDADFARFLSYAMGSASELEYLLFLSSELQLLGIEAYKEEHGRLIEIKKMLYALIVKLKPSESGSSNSTREQD
jgi:four helix bundle protein